MLGTSTRPGFGSRDSGIRAGPEDQQRQDDRHGHQQDGAPPEVLHQPAAEDRAQRGAAGEAGGPDGHGQPAPVGLGEDVADQGQGGGHQHGAEEAQPGASGDQPFGAGGERCGRRDGGEAGAADEEQPPAADPVAEAAHRHQQAGEDQGIGVDNPEQLHAGGVEAAAIAGRAKVRAVLSTATSSTGNISSASASQSRHGARVPGGGARRRAGGAAVPVLSGDGMLLMSLTIPSGRYS